MFCATFPWGDPITWVEWGADMETIYHYTDYRRYLKDRYQEAKAKSPVFSFRYFSQHAGFSSPNFLKLVMDGKRNLSPDSIHKFASVFKMSTREQRFFELLVSYNQAAEPRQRQHYYQQLLEFPGYRQIHQLEQEQYAYLSHWYYPAIVELVALPDFREDAQWICEKLQHKVSPKEVRDAIYSLLSIGLLKRSAEGRLEQTHKSVTTGEEARSLAAYSFHEQVLEHAKGAVQVQAPAEREFAAITMAINENQLAGLKDLIRDFRKSVMNFLGKEGGPPTAVYQFSAQLFALTNTKSGGKTS